MGCGASRTSGEHPEAARQRGATSSSSAATPQASSTTPTKQSENGSPPTPTSSDGRGQGSPIPAPLVTTTSSRPALQVRKLGRGPLSCLSAQPSVDASGTELTSACKQHLASLTGPSSTPAAKQQAAAFFRQLLCGAKVPAKGLCEAGLPKALVALLQAPDAQPDAKLDAAWALTNLAVGSYEDAESVCIGGAVEALVVCAGPTVKADLQEQALWALGNITGALQPGVKTQSLAVEVLDGGLLRPLLGVLAAEADAAATRRSSSGGSGGSSAGGARTQTASATPLLRVATWCLHNLGKHKREKDMVNSIPVVTRLLLEASDLEVLTCCAWMLAFMGSNEENKTHLKQALVALPRLVQWVREANSSLATPSLLCLGTMCTGYMRVLDYSTEVVEAGGVPAMLSYLKKAGLEGRQEMQKEALFALSNVAGGNNATVRAMLDAGAFGDVVVLLRNCSVNDLRMECLYVLTNAWDPLVGVEVNTAQALVSSGILQELHALLDPASTDYEMLALLLKGLADGLKKGQQLMTHAANMQLVEHGPEGCKDLPPPQNPVAVLYRSQGTVDRIQALNSHPHEEVATRANGILTVLQFMS